MMSAYSALRAIEQDLSSALEDAFLGEDSRDIIAASHKLEPRLPHRGGNEGAWREAAGLVARTGQKIQSAKVMEPRNKELVAARGMLDQYSVALRSGMKAEGMGRAAQTLIHGLEVEEAVLRQEGQVAVDQSNSHSHSIDMACVALLAKFLASQFNAEGLEPEGFEIEQIALVVDALERDSAHLGLPRPMAMSTKIGIPYDVMPSPGPVAAPAAAPVDEPLRRASLEYRELPKGITPYENPKTILTRSELSAPKGMSMAAPCVLCNKDTRGHRCAACAGVFCSDCCFSGSSSYDSGRRR